MPEPAVAAADQGAYSSRGGDILTFAALGVLSGIASFLAAKYSQLPFLHLSFFPDDAYRGSAPILPGVIFGLLVAACAHHFGARGRWRLLLAMVLTTLAWVLAFDLASQADMQLGLQVSSQARGAFALGVGGFVGGFGTCLAVAIAHPRFRRLGAWLLTALVATFFGAIEQVYELAADLFENAALCALFIVWQTAVIASIAATLGRK